MIVAGVGTDERKLDVAGADGLETGSDGLKTGPVVELSKEMLVT
jgi:hypothetical protein